MNEEQFIQALHEKGIELTDYTSGAIQKIF